MAALNIVHRALQIFALIQSLSHPLAAAQGSGYQYPACNSTLFPTTNGVRITRSGDVQYRSEVDVYAFDFVVIGANVTGIYQAGAAQEAGLITNIVSVQRQGAVVRSRIRALAVQDKKIPPGCGYLVRLIIDGNEVGILDLYEAQLKAATGWYLDEYKLYGSNSAELTGFVRHTAYPTPAPTPVPTPFPTPPTPAPTPLVILTEAAGAPNDPGPYDGVGGDAQFDAPEGIDFLPNGDAAVVADFGNNAVRLLRMSDFSVTTIAGALSGSPARPRARTIPEGFTDGAGDVAFFSGPGAIKVEKSEGKFALVTDVKNSAIRRISLDCVNDASLPCTTTTVAGGTMCTCFSYDLDCNAACGADGDASIARFNQPRGLALTIGGTFAVVVDQLNQKVRLLQLSNDTVSAVKTVAGPTPYERGFKNGVGDAVRFFNPIGVDFSPTGNHKSLHGVYALVADSGNNCIRKLEFTPSASSGEGTAFDMAGLTVHVSTFVGKCGIDNYGSTDGIGESARFEYPTGVVFGTEDYAYIADFGNHRIRKVWTDASGVLEPRLVLTIIGNHKAAGHVLGPGLLATLDGPHTIAISPHNPPYSLVTDATRHIVRKIYFPTPSPTPFPTPVPTPFPSPFPTPNPTPAPRFFGEVVADYCGGWKVNCADNPPGPDEDDPLTSVQSLVTVAVDGKLRSVTRVFIGWGCNEPSLQLTVHTQGRFLLGLKNFNVSGNMTLTRDPVYAHNMEQEFIRQDIAPQTEEERKHWVENCPCVRNWEIGGRHDVASCSKSTCPAATEWHSCKFRRSTVSPNSLCGRYFTTKFRDFGTVCHGLAMPDIEEAYRERPKMCGFKRTNLPLNHKYDPICQDTFPDDFVSTFVAYTASNNESAAHDAFGCGRSTSAHTMISACVMLAMVFARLL